MKIKSSLLYVILTLCLSAIFSKYANSTEIVGEVTADIYKVEFRSNIGTNYKMNFNVFCIEGYKFYNLDNRGEGRSDIANQFFVNENGQSVPSKCE